MNSKTIDRCETGRKTLEVELLTSEYSRRLTVAGHHAWRESLSAQQTADDDFDDLIEIDPFNGDPPSKRKDSELARVLAVLDSLERGTVEP